jgi:hypothetical protein
MTVAELPRGGRTYVRKLRATCQTSDPLLLRLRLVNALSRAGLQPRALGPDAILCVRRFGDPLPRAIRPDNAGEPPSAEWRAAAATALDGVVRRAARPEHGMLASDATDAVLFADFAELLACLSTDWLAGRVASRWWWKALLGSGLDATEMVAVTWLTSPRFAPAAIEKLAACGQAAAALHVLSPKQASELLRRIVVSFGLSALRDVVAIEGGETSTPLWRVTRPGAAPPTTTEDLPATRDKADAPPWQAWIGNDDAPDLDVDRHMLLCVALTLRRAPAWVRTAAFAQQVLVWRTGEGSIREAHRQTSGEPAIPSQTPVHGPQVDLPPAATPARVELAESRAEPGVVEESSREASPPAAGPPRPVATHGEPRPLVVPERRSVSVLDVSAASPASDMAETDRTVLSPKTGVLIGEAESGSIGSSARVSPDGVVSEEVRATVHVPRVDPTVTQETDEPNPETAAAPYRVDTQLGGLFYLINVALALGLYADFSAPEGPGLQLSLWDFLFLLGRRLVPGMRSDPVWRLLAQLAGHSPGEQAAARYFQAPREWSVPVSWLEPFPEDGIWRWSVADGYLMVRHSAGFLVVHRALTGSDVTRQLLEACYPYRDVSRFELRYSRRLAARIWLLRKWRMLERGDADLHQWLDWLAEYLDARLMRAFGATEQHSPFQLLIQHPARVLVTDTHLTVVLSLESLPIAIRQAGLDRDPGWVPAGGRFVRFLFETSGERIA